MIAGPARGIRADTTVPLFLFCTGVIGYFTSAEEAVFQTHPLKKERESDENENEA